MASKRRTQEQDIVVHESVIVQVHLRAGLLSIEQGNDFLQACSAKQSSLLRRHIRQRLRDELIVWRQLQRLGVGGMCLIKLGEEKVRGGFA